MWRKITKFVMIQIVISILVIFTWQIFPKSDIYRNSYLCGVFDDIERLKLSRGENRIILLGGSSVGFSVSAEKLTEYFGIHVLNLGTHVGIGYDNIWSIYQDYLDPSKDMIVISPEYCMPNIKGYSKIYGQIIFLSKDLVFLLKNIEYLPFVARQTIKDIIYYITNNKDDGRVYTRDAFNSYGDVIAHYHKKYDKPREEFIVISSDSETEEYISFIQNAILNNGYKLCYVPTTIPNSRCDGIFDELVHFQDNLCDSLEQVKMHNHETLCFQDNYFYDTNYHMSFEGNEQKTKIFYNYVSQCL